MRWAGLITKNFDMETELNKNEKFSTEMLIRTMNGTLTHNGYKYVLFLFYHIEKLNYEM
jgi:predicted RNase H-related nuclease YkuK (DUF458 family)